MRFHFTKFERVAGLFVLTALFGFIFSLVTVAVKQGWFDSKIYFTTTFESADGVHPGSVVQISGLKAGAVEEVDLTNENKIKIKFYVLERFAEKVQNESTVTLIRPFLIGERALDVSAGLSASRGLAKNRELLAVESTDLLTLISGKKMGVYLSSLGEMASQLNTIAMALLDKNRTQSLVHLIDRMEPLVKNLNTMSVEVIKLSQQATNNQHLDVVLTEAAKTAQALNAFLPDLHKSGPALAKDLAMLVNNLSQLTEQMKLISPAMTEIVPELPRVSKRAIEALDESVVLMKAIQKSMFVKSNVQEVREEEAILRKPANLQLDQHK